MTDQTADDPDRPLWGARAIAAEAGIFRLDGSPDDRKAFYLLERKFLDATKVGRRYVSTPRRIRAAFASKPNT